MQETTGKKIQITEFDMSLGSREIVRVFGNNADTSLQQVYEHKNNRMEIISKIIRESGVKLSGISYWSLTDGIDCNLERLRTNALSSGQITDIRQIPTACGGLIPTHQSMYKNIQQNTTLNKEELTSTVTKKGFDQRSQSEIQIAKQIKEKNMFVKQQKEQQKTQEKPKVKTLTKQSNNASSSSSGFVNTLILTSITAFVAGALFMLVYYICK